jgi:hypothetical protein
VTYNWVRLEREIAGLRGNPLVVLDYGKINMARGLMLFSLLTAAFFVVLYFWARKRPFAAILTALIVYAGDTALSFILTPDNPNVSVLKYVFIIFLIKGVLSANRQRLNQ